MQPERVREQVLDELELIEATLKKIDAILRDLSYRDVTDAEQAASALYLANLYSGIESIALRLCKVSGVPVPSGENWHVDLLNLLSPGTVAELPVLFDEPLLLDLDGYRKFRHVVHHRYATSIDWAQMLPLLLKARTVLTAFTDRVRDAIYVPPPAGTPSAPKE